MAVVFDVAGSACSFLSKYLLPLAERRGAENFHFVNELDYVIGKAIRKMGPRVVLSYVDLQITGEETSFDFQRSWLLPVLRDNVQNTELAFFIDYFYPLAEKCRLRSHKCINFDDKVQVAPLVKFFWRRKYVLPL
jgi:ribosomal RNA-processing protein 12